MGTDQNGDESGKRMVTGGDTLLWRSGSNKTAVSSDSFLNIAMSGVNKNYVPYLALKQKRGEKIYDETNNQWHDRSRFTGS